MLKERTPYHDSCVYMWLPTRVYRTSLCNLHTPLLDTDGTTSSRNTTAKRPARLPPNESQGTTSARERPTAKDKRIRRFAHSSLFSAYVRLLLLTYELYVHLRKFFPPLRFSPFASRFPRTIAGSAVSCHTGFTFTNG